MATETLMVPTTEVAASTTTTSAIYPAPQTTYTIATDKKYLVADVVTPLSVYSVLEGTVKPADYDTLEIVYAWTNETGTANVSYGVQTSPDGASWLPHTIATGAITAVGVSKLEVTGFQKYLRLYYTESGTGTIDVQASLTFKKKVA
jgi:hypothetical protein